MQQVVSLQQSTRGQNICEQSTSIKDKTDTHMKQLFLCPHLICILVDKLLQGTHFTKWLTGMQKITSFFLSPYI